jgi:filamentous hemagglutinin family protein
MDHNSRSKSKATRFVLNGLALSVMLALGTNVYALPSGGAVSAGSASIDASPGKLTINQASQNAAINWQSFSIGQTEAVQFVQPNSSSVALNRVLGSDPSSILGSLSANGKVFLVNPNGILFAKGAQVNVGALVASTRNITDGDFMAGNYKFSGNGNGTVVNQGSINADGGYVALLGATVSNEGTIVAKLGTIALAAGNAFTLDVAGDGLLNVVVNQGAVDALVQNGGLIKADGGQVLLTALSAGNLLQSAVNNTGVIQAQTVESHNGTIRLLGDMQSGTVSVSGTLDVTGTGAGQTGGNVTVTGQHVGLFGGHINASGDAGGGTVLVGGGFQGKNPNVQNASATYMSADSTIAADAITNGNGGTVVVWSNDSTRAYGGITARGGAQGGNGGLIETSGHWLDVGDANVNASAPNGRPGMWLLDPADVTIVGAATSNGSVAGGVFAPDSGVSAANFESRLLAGGLQTILNAGTSITVTTTNNGVPGGGNGDINVNAALTWTPAATSTLTLNAARDVNLNAAISPTNGNLVVCCGRDVNVNAPISTVGGSILLSAGNNVNMNAAVSASSGNITMCAGNNVNVSAALTIVDFAAVPSQSLGLANGLVLSAGNNGTGPGVAGGTVIFAPLTPPAAITRAPVNIFYNPVSYTTPTDFSTGVFFTLVGPGSPLTEFMLVFPDGATKAFDGTTVAAFTGLKGNPAGVTLAGAGTANFDTAAVGLNKTVTFSGFNLLQGPILPGGAAINYALPGSSICCAGAVQRTTANITAAAVVVAPGIVPPVVLATPADELPLIVLPLFYPFTRLAGLDLSVEGIRMPAIALAETPPPPPVVVPPPPPPVFVPPPRRAVRN